MVFRLVGAEGSPFGDVLDLVLALLLFGCLLAFRVVVVTRVEVDSSLRLPFGDRYEVYWAVRRALDASGWRLFGDHELPVRNEPRPHPDEILRAARALLPPEVSARVDDDRLRREVERQMPVTAWPFDVLVS